MGVFCRQEKYTGEEGHGNSDRKAAESLYTDLFFPPCDGCEWVSLSVLDMGTHSAQRT